MKYNFRVYVNVEKIKKYRIKVRSYACVSYSFNITCADESVRVHSTGKGFFLKNN
jgi:hypothetical protein